MKMCTGVQVVGGPNWSDLEKVEPPGFASTLERKCEIEDGYDFGLNIWKNGVDVYWNGEDCGKDLGEKHKFYFGHVELRCIQYIE